jgi:hypothetical protein
MDVKMTDDELFNLVTDLRAAAATWFRDDLLMKLEALIAETQRARTNERRLLDSIHATLESLRPGMLT